MPLFKVQTGNQAVITESRSDRNWDAWGVETAPDLPGQQNYVEAQDAIEALSLVKPDYTTWSEESLKHTGHLTDEAKRSMFDAYLLDWSADVRVTMLSRDNVVYSHWVKELGEIALEKAELDIRLNEQQEANIGIMRNNKELFDQNAGLRREHAQLIEERDKARAQRDEYCSQAESLAKQVSNLLSWQGPPYPDSDKTEIESMAEWLRTAPGRAIGSHLTQKDRSQFGRIASVLESIIRSAAKSAGKPVKRKR